LPMVILGALTEPRAPGFIRPLTRDSRVTGLPTSNLHPISLAATAAIRFQSM
jgi:hypothetical protein